MPSTGAGPSRPCSTTRRPTASHRSRPHGAGAAGDGASAEPAAAELAGGPGCQPGALPGAAGEVGERVLGGGVGAGPADRGAGGGEPEPAVRAGPAGEPDTGAAGGAGAEPQLNAARRPEAEGAGGPGRACLASVRDDSKGLRFYTGFGSAQRLAAFLAFLSEGEPRRGAEPGPPSALSPSSSWCWCGWGCSCRIWPFASSSPRPLPPATGSAGPSSWRPGWPRCRCGAARVERFEPQRASRVRGVPRVVLDCAQLRSEGRGRQLYALQDCALAAPSGFLLQCRPAGRGGGGRAGAAPFLRDGPVALSAQQGEACLQLLSLASLADKALRFRFLHGVQPPTMEGQVGRAWAICCYLACLLHEPMGLA
ncbi:uncharacterized protein LOC125628457 [Caretta caretta]|uniref:uncharacterized protein LOC125628457 n=1 Tax=Caretta caretta TaxID=8467 RepID=UPI003F4B8D65